MAITTPIMGTIMLEVLQYDFVRNALLAGLLVSLVCGVVGTYVVANRIVFLAGGIAHAAYGGVGLSLVVGIPFLWGVLAFSLVSSWWMGWLTWRDRSKADTAVGVLWACGMALGAVLVDLSPGYAADLMAYLFGSILTVDATTLYSMLALSALVLAVVFWYYRDFLALSHDPEFAQLRGVPATRLWMVLVSLVALSVVVSIQAVGLILVIALMTIPANIASHHCRRLSSMMATATGLGLLFTWSGIAVSWWLDLGSGPVIILVAGIAYALDSLLLIRYHRA